MSDTVTRIALATRLEIGAQLNDTYEIDERIASGGMGEVYRGHNIETGEPVAIKTILPELADQAAILALFKREAANLARLHHDAIVRYYSFARDPRLDRRYLAMEFVDGISLADRIAAGPLTSSQVCRLFASVAEGLALAHDSGVIHRDLSPDNIILRSGDIGRPKLIDFGIARSANFSEGTLIGGSFAGKYNFVSPEQLGIDNREVDGRSDIYSLGLVIAACLRGQPLDMGGSHAEVIGKRSKVPDLSDINGRLRPLLEAMLQPNPDNRPIDARMVADWLRTSRQKEEQPGPVDAGEPANDLPGFSEDDPIANAVGRELNSTWIGASGDTAGRSGQGDFDELIGIMGFDPRSRPTEAGISSGSGIMNSARSAGELPETGLNVPVWREPERRQSYGLWYRTGAVLLVLLLGGLAYLVWNSFQQTAVLPDNTAVGDRPSDNTQTSVPPSRNSPTADRPGKTQTAGDAPEEGGGAPDGGKDGATDPRSDPYTRVATFIRDYPGGDCFVAVPTMGEGKSVTFRTFARDKAGQENFRRALHDVGDLEIEAGGDVADPQCPALSFVHGTKRYPGFSLLIDLNEADIADGTKLSGSVLNVGGPQLHVLLVDDDGLVQSIDRYLSPGDGANRTFQVPLVLTGNSVASTQMLMAIATDPPIPELNDINQPAGVFFRWLNQKIESLNADIDIAVEGFELQPEQQTGP